MCPVLTSDPARKSGALFREILKSVYNSSHLCRVAHYFQFWPNSKPGTLLFSDSNACQRERIIGNDWNGEQLLDQPYSQGYDLDCQKSPTPID